MLNGPFYKTRVDFFIKKKKNLWDVFGGPVVENPPCNAGDVGLIPGRETKIPRAAGRLSPRTATPEPVHLN